MDTITIYTVIIIRTVKDEDTHVFVHPFLTLQDAKKLLYKRYQQALASFFEDELCIIDKVSKKSFHVATPNYTESGIIQTDTLQIQEIKK